MVLITRLSDERLELYEKDGVEYGLASDVILKSLRASLIQEEFLRRRIYDIEADAKPLVTYIKMTVDMPNRFQWDTIRGFAANLRENLRCSKKSG